MKIRVRSVKAPGNNVAFTCPSTKAGRPLNLAAVTVDYYHEWGLFHHSIPGANIRAKTVYACTAGYCSQRVNMARDFHT